MLGVLACPGQQDGVRAEFDECVVPGLEQPPQCRREPHRRTQIRHPVVGVEQRLAHQFPGDRRIHRHRRHGRLQLHQAAAQAGGKRLHLRAVRSDIDIDPAAEPLPLLQFRHQLFEHRTLTGKHRRSVAVARGDGNLTLVAGDELLGLGQGGLGDHHRPAAPNAAQHPRAGADHSGGVIEAQRARDMGGGGLAEAVPDHGGGLDAPGPPQRCQRHLNREDGRLQDADVAELRTVLGTV
nr:hypothetical protein CPGR_01273 [Mycolicibacter nonchromogenicus]